jgi:hypothetical protein
MGMRWSYSRFGEWAWDRLMAEVNKFLEVLDTVVGIGNICYSGQLGGN